MGTSIIDSTRFSWAASWSRAFRRQLNGQGQAHVVCVGDSVLQGFYGNTPYYTESWAGVFAAALAACSAAEPGSGMIPLHEEFEVTDPRVSRTGTWATDSSAGFYSLLKYPTTTATFTLGPISCSSFRVIYATSPTGGAFTAAVDGGAATNLTSLGTAGLHVVDLAAGSEGSHTLVLACTSPATMFIVSVEAIANPTVGVKLSRICESGRRTDEVLVDTSAISSLSCLKLTQPDLAVIGFGLNDSYQGSTTFLADTNLLVDTLKNLGASVLIVVPPPPDLTWIPAWEDYRAILLAVASAKNCGLVDMSAEWTSHVAATELFFDNVHPNPVGQSAMGGTVTRYVLNAIGTAPPLPADDLADIADLALLIDHNSTLTFNGVESIQQINDQSGNNRHFTQATSTNRPHRGMVNGRTAFNFVTNDWMSAGDTLDLGTSSVSIFAAIKLGTPAIGVIVGKFKDTSADGSYLLYAASSSGIKLGTIYDAGTPGTAASSSTLPGVTPLIVGTIINRSAGTITQRINGATAGTGSFTPDSASSRNNTTPLYMGALRNIADTGFTAGWYLDGFVMAIRIYLHAVSNAERDRIEAQMAALYQ